MVVYYAIIPYDTKLSYNTILDYYCPHPVERKIGAEAVVGAARVLVVVRADFLGARPRAHLRVGFRFVWRGGGGGCMLRTHLHRSPLPPPRVFLHFFRWVATVGRVDGWGRWGRSARPPTSSMMCVGRSVLELGVCGSILGTRLHLPCGSHFCVLFVQLHLPFWVSVGLF